jgi:hypothetical protein
MTVTSGDCSGIAACVNPLDARNCTRGEKVTHLHPVVWRSEREPEDHFPGGAAAAPLAALAGSAA